MKKLSCELLLHYFFEVSEYADLRSTYIANSAVNIFLSYSAIMLNTLAIHAIRKTSSLPRTSKTLLVSLAISDVGIGLLGQPFYTSLLVKKFQQNIPGCHTYIFFAFIINVFSLASFLGVAILSVDRFLAIHLHLRYQELVSHKRVVAVVISIWLLSVLIPLTLFWFPLGIYLFIILCLGVIGLLLTAAVYIRIYLAIRRHKNQIRTLQAQHVAQIGEMANFASLIKSTINAFYVYLVFLACYMPFFVNFIACKIHGPSIASKKFFLVSVTLVFLNSSLNPVIYCWKMRNIRLALMDILRKMSSFRTQ